MPSVCFLMVCLVRLECFVASLDIVFIAIKTEVAREGVIDDLECSPRPDCFRIVVTSPKQNIDQDLFVGPLNDLQTLYRLQCLRFPCMCHPSSVIMKQTCSYILQPQQMSRRKF